jgi:phosphoribosylglycinamide formyltransferase 1
MRAILLTSNLRRHQFVANRLAERLELAGVWQEEKSFQPLRYAESADDEAVIQRHFAARDQSEAAFFADHGALRIGGGTATLVAPGGCNDPAQLARLRAMSPDVVLVFGTSLLRQPLIDAFAGRVINLHLGLSPYYRGAGTNFWPLVNGEPEYCGATIHFLDAGVDTGPIIAHARPAVAVGDGPHDVGNKTIIAAVEALADAAIAHAESPLGGVAQWAGGRVYRRADFSAAAVRQLYANVERGMIDDYARRTAGKNCADLSAVGVTQAERDRPLRLITMRAQTSEVTE